MANYSSLRGPVGMNRVYARVPAGEINPEAWMAALKAGRTFATNGPLLGFTLGGAQIGDELDLAAAQPHVPFSVRLRSIVAVDHLELVCNGRVVQSFIARKGVGQGEFHGRVALQDSGWCVARASTDTGRYPVLDNYVYATTSPVYVTVAKRKPHSPDDARYFAAWIDRITETTGAHRDWNDAAEKRSVFERLAAAKAVFVGME